MTNGTEKPPIDAVREQIAELRDDAANQRELADVLAFGRKPHYEFANRLEWAANALEAVLDAAPCDHTLYDGRPCTWARSSHPRTVLEETHDYASPMWLTRAITKGEQWDAHK